MSDTSNFGSSPEPIDVLLFDWELRSKLLAETLEVRGFFVAAAITIADRGEPLPSDSVVGRMRVGVLDVRVYRRLLKRCVDAGLLTALPDGRTTCPLIEQHLATKAINTENRRRASVAREARLRAERGVRVLASELREPLSDKLRDDVWRKTGGICVYCGTSLTLISGLPNSFRADHVLAVVRGGKNDIGNLVPSCFECNAKKSAKTALEFMNGDAE